ncbi:WSC domain-containing protein 2-like isoform X2 [Anneissia japonica]|nr:WSC domain-containing protein 2-like isoform X2 [Anneissia japonica]
MFTKARVNDGEDVGLPLLVKSRSSAEKKNAFVEYTGKTWMSFTDVDSPGVYRACVPRPYPETNLQSTVTGGIVDDTKQMTIIHCLNMCIKLSYTYAALGKGTQCLCSNIRSKENTLLDYKDSKFCDVPCSGEALYNCGGEQYLSLYRTKVTDARCSNIGLKPKGSLPLVALASYPRSGNTWTRQLIEKASGIYTGSTLWEHEKQMKISQKGLYLRVAF